MPLVFSIEEVREYLSEMGYGDLTDDDLDKFVHDLRKLIKRDSRQRRRVRLGHTGRTHSDLSSSAEASSARDSSGVEDTSQSIVEQEPDGRARLLRTPKSKLKKQRPRRVEISSDFSGTHDTTSGTTEASGTGTTNESNNTGVSETSTSLSSSTPLSSSDAPLREWNGNRNVEVGGDRRKGTKAARPTVVKTRQAPQRREQPPEAEGVDENIQLLGGEESSSSASSVTELSDTDLLYLMEHILKVDTNLSETGSQAETTKKKFEVPMKIRRDPVALYHWYKTFWEKQKAPGEDRHMQLRWNVRAGTIGRFPCDDEGNPIQYLPLNPIRPRKKIPAF